MKTVVLHRILLLGAAVFFLASCQQVVITVDSIPANTPANQPLFIVGNFNNWDPGDERYQLELNSDSTFSVELPPGFGTIEYKFTRGDWTTVEKDICGYEIDNRRTVIGDQDTVVDQIFSWNDLDPLNCPRLTLLVKDIPENTPEEDVLAIAGNFNSWAVDSSTQLRKDEKGNYSITIQRPTEVEELEFKMTRGDLASAESDEFGNMIPNRVLRFGVRDTIEIDVKGWIDRPLEMGNRVIIILEDLPGNTPRNAEIFLACSMNGWNPGDRNFLFQKSRDGKLFFPFPRKNKPLEFKVTRGNWHSVEVDRFGYGIGNRYVDLLNTDTLRISVEGWNDLSTQSNRPVTVIIDQLPETTPESPDLFLTGNFCGWNPARSKYRFRELPNGEFLVDIPRGTGDLVFKVTRGSWSRAEVDAFGNDVPNRVVAYKDVDTLYIGIQNWKDRPVQDIPRVTLVIRSLPENTPGDDKLFLAPDFNGWNPGDPELVFNALPDGRPYLTIRSSGKQLEFKITRGNWETVEVDLEGNTINDRVLNYGFSDTVYIDVAGWRDFIGNY